MGRGEDPAGNDLDLLVELDDSPSLFDLAWMHLELQELLGIRVDVLDNKVCGTSTGASSTTRCRCVDDSVAQQCGVDAVVALHDFRGFAAQAARLVARGRPAFDSDEMSETEDSVQLTEAGDVFVSWWLQYLELGR